MIFCSEQRAPTNPPPTSAHHRARQRGRAGPNFPRGFLDGGNLVEGSREIIIPNVADRGTTSRGDGGRGRRLCVGTGGPPSSAISVIDILYRYPQRRKQTSRDCIRGIHAPTPKLDASLSTSHRPFFAHLTICPDDCQTHAHHRPPIPRLYTHVHRAPTRRADRNRNPRAGKYDSSLSQILEISLGITVPRAWAECR